MLNIKNNNSCKTLEVEKFYKFLAKFTPQANFFVPKDISDNIYRHYGCKFKEHRLYIEDVLHIHNSNTYFLEDLCMNNDQLLVLKVIYHVRNSGFNVFRDTCCFKILTRTKHFDRKKVNEYQKLYIVNKEEIANTETNKIVAVCGETDFVFLKLIKIHVLELDCEKSNYKTNKQ